MSTLPLTRSRNLDLFRDWCAAAGRPFLPATAETIALFLQDVPAAASTQIKRIQAIRRAHREADLTLALPVHEPQSPWRTGPGWLDLADTLNRVPLSGWPGGAAAHRDAFLAVLAGGCGLSREDCRAVAAKDIVQDREAAWSIRGCPLPRTADAGPCPSCAVARWLHILDLWDTRGRAAVREYVAGYRPDGTHRCLETSTHPQLMIYTLLPGIDRHGWLADWEPLSARSISAVLAYRQDAARFPRDPVAPLEEPAGEVPDYQRTSMQDLTDLLDELDDRVAAVLRETEAALESALAAALDPARLR